MVDIAINDLVVQLVDYTIDQWKMDGDCDKQHSSEKNGSPPIRKIYVNNLSKRTSYNDLYRLFGQYGKVVDAYISRDKYSHMKKGYGFVTFKYPEEALSVLKLKKGELKLHFRDLFVAPADSWHQPVELPDGKILWKPKSKKNGSVCYEEVEADSYEQQSSTEGTTSIGSESVSGDDQEMGAVGGCDLPLRPDSCDGTNQQEKKEIKEEEADGDDGDEEESIEVQEGECLIHILNNDCLMHIFSFLTKRERIRIERVCKRWQMVCMDTWMYQKHLDFMWLFPTHSSSYLTLPILEVFLKRCGENLHSLDLSHKPHDLNAGVLRTVAHYCKNLRCLNLSGLPMTSAGLRILSTVCGELRVLNLEGCAGAHDKDLRRVFTHSVHLESLTLSSNNNLNGRSLHGLSAAPLKELVLDECNNLRSQHLVNGLRLLKNLTHLSLNSCINLTSSDVASIVGVLPRLQSLSMACYFPLFNNVALKPLDQLHDLISLNLHLNPAVNNNIMDAITKGCSNLKELDISGCSSGSFDVTSLTDDGLKCLARLPNLIDVSMSYLANVSDEALVMIGSRGKLRKLVCRGCPAFTDAGCIGVVTSCSELELFDFSGCDFVSKATVQAALDSVKLRTNNVKLKLVVGGTSVEGLDSLEKNPLLEVDTSDHSVAHLRPDFVDDIYFPSSENEDDYDYDYDYAEVDDMCDWEWECRQFSFGDDLDYCDDFLDDFCGFVAHWE